MLNRSASLAMSTSVLKALPGKLDIKRHSPSILYVLLILEFDILSLNDLNTGFHRQSTLPNVVKKLLAPYKKSEIDGASESMLNLLNK